ncbi:MAG: YybS family protein [Synergistaceae bacterium]|jgi:uncharacterized protein YybS (DUF2232 family)|nr:YybS family protein [Synergistaceae bacterium]
MFPAGFRDWMICTAASSMMYVLGLLSPIMARPLSLFYSFPSMLSAFEHGALFALSCALFSAAAAAMVTSEIYGVMVFLMFGLSGLLTGLAARCGLKDGNLIVAASGFEFAGKFAAVVLYFQVSGINLMSPNPADIEKMIQVFTGVQADSPLTRDAAAGLALLVPYNMILFSAVEAILCMLLVSFIHRKKKGKGFFALPPFSSWFFPRSLLIALLAGFICVRFAQEKESLYMMRQVGANLSEISKTFFIVQGLSCLYYFMEQRGTPRFLRITAVFFAPFIPVLSYVLAVTGIADMGFNFRRRARGT